MSARIVATGAIANPELRWTPQQRAVLELRFCATARTYSKVTNEWSDAGSALWLSASFWDEEAQNLANLLVQGDRVTVEGTLVLETFQRKNGDEGTSLEIRNPRFLGYLPGRRHQEAESSAGAADDPPSALSIAASVPKDPF